MPEAKYCDTRKSVPAGRPVAVDWHYRGLMRLIAAVGLLLGFHLFADDLSTLRSGQRVQIAMIGQGPLCKGAVVSAAGVAVLVRTSITAAECGPKGEIISISKASIVDLVA